MKWKREIFGGQHEPLISKKLFDTCQEVMGKRGRVHEVHKNNFAFLGLLKCASCGASITAEKQKGHHYYRCTKKKGLCQEKYYLREEALTEQIKNFLQKVSLSSQDTEKVLAALDSEQDKAREDAQNEVSILKEQLSQVETKGLSWLEPAREFVKSLNQAANLLSSPNPSAMTTFLKNIGSNHILRNREFVFTHKIEYKLVAERSEAYLSNLQFPTWCPGWDSNPHAFRHTILSRDWLPITAPGRTTNVKLKNQNVNSVRSLVRENFLEIFAHTE